VFRICDICVRSGCRSWSSDPYFWLMDPDVDPAPGSCSFLQWPSRRQVFLIITFWTYFYIIFQRYKVTKESRNSRNQGFSLFFAWWLKDPDLDLADLDPGGPKTFGSGSATLLLRGQKSLQTHTLWLQCLLSAGRLCSPRTWSWNAANGKLLLLLLCRSEKDGLFLNDSAISEVVGEYIFER
jgi:hypothetical protein